MPTESTKAAINQLRDAGFESVAAKIRDLVLHVEAQGGQCGVGFIEWRPENGAAQILIRYVSDTRGQPPQAATSAAR